jgi:hypothetical protein
MRLITISKLLVLGGTVAWAAKRLARPKQTNRVERSDFEPDPADPVQSFDDATDMHVSDLGVDAVDSADIEAAQDLASLESDLDEASLEIDTPSQTTLDAQDVAVDETGELYGVHTPRAVDNSLPDDRAAFDEGQNWIEALETSAVEYGAEPEQELDVIDDQDVPPHPSDMRDTPVADRGSGGPGGV